MTMPKFEKSTAKNKKYSVITPLGKKINFGDNRYKQYKDTALGLYKNKDHKDNERRDRYRKRHKQIKTKDGKLAYKNKESPSYYSYNYLW